MQYFDTKMLATKICKLSKGHCAIRSVFEPFSGLFGVKWDGTREPALESLLTIIRAST